VPSYLVETYVPRMDADGARAARQRARGAARQLSREGEPVRYLRTTLLPEDETCFHLFEADSEDAVAEVCRRAGLAEPRIVRAVE
jgi:muconolactone delta-isomerase